jgi:hypothetical protein
MHARGCVQGRLWSTRGCACSWHVASWDLKFPDGPEKSMRENYTLSVMSTPQSLPELFTQVVRQEHARAPWSTQPTNDIAAAVGPNTTPLAEVLATSSILPGKPDMAVTGTVVYHMLVACSAFPTNPVAAWESLFYNIVHNVVLRDAADPSSTAVDLAAAFGSTPGALKEVALTPESEPVNVYDVTADITGAITSALSAALGDGIGATSERPEWKPKTFPTLMLARVITDINNGAWSLGSFGFNPANGAYTIKARQSVWVGGAHQPELQPNHPRFLVPYVSVNLLLEQSRTKIVLRKRISFTIPPIKFTVSRTPLVRPRLVNGMRARKMSQTMITQITDLLMFALSFNWVGGTPLKNTIHPFATSINVYKAEKAIYYYKPNGFDTDYFFDVAVTVNTASGETENCMLYVVAPLVFQASPELLSVEQTNN